MPVRLGFALAIIAASLFNCLPASELQAVQFDFGLYFPVIPTVDPEIKLQELLKEKYKSSLLGTPELQDHKVTGRWVPTGEYAPPSQEAFRYFARDVPAEIAPALAAAPRVFVLTFKGSPSELNVLNKHAYELVADLAQVTAGLIWDDECRLLYSVREWRKQCVDSWDGDLPDVRSLVTMHAYRNPDLVRIVTLGMRKFGCPDLVIDQVPSGNSRPAGNTINACAQLMLEGARPKGGRIVLELSTIRHSAMRASALENPGEGATGKIEIRFINEAREEGDPSNTLWKIDFPSIADKSVTERELIAFSALFGSTDRIIRAKHSDQDIRLASERARKEFFEKEAAFRKGFQPNERLMVKSGFPVKGETEYMWVEVIGWKADSVEGILANDSFYDKSLVEGKRVNIKFTDIYDYIHYKPDGTEEGNETSKVLEKTERN